MYTIYALFIVLNEVDYLDDLIAALVDVGVSGATILDSQGMASLIVSNKNHDIPIFGSLKLLLEDSRPYNKTIFSVIENENLAERTANMIQEVMEDAGPSAGFMFTVPIGKKYELGSVKK